MLDPLSRGSLAATRNTKQEKSLRPFKHTSSGDKVAVNLNKKFHCHPYNEGIILDGRSVKSETKQMVLDNAPPWREHSCNHLEAKTSWHNKSGVQWSRVSRGSCAGSRANQPFQVSCRSTLSPPAPLPACICKNACPCSGKSTMLFTLFDL